MNVTKIRITAGELLPRVHEAARSSSNVIFIPPLQMRSMAGMMNFQQALSCLRKGKIVGKPKINSHGDWEVIMERYAANQWFRLKVIVKINGLKIEKLYAILSEQENV